MLRLFSRTFLILSGFVSLYGLAACSSVQTGIPTGPNGYHVVAQSSSSMPSWVEDIGRWSNDGHHKDDVWFYASSPQENSLQGAKHDAFIRAQRKASDRIGDQNWNLVANTVKRRLSLDTQTMMRIKDDTKNSLRQSSQGWLVGGEEYQYYWLEYQPKHPEQVPSPMRTLYRAWVLVRYTEPNWECSRKNSLKLLPLVASNLGGQFGFKRYDQKRFESVLTDITNKNLSLIPDNVCVGG